MKLHSKKKNILLKRVVSVFLSILLLIPFCGAFSYVGSCYSANLSADREVRAGYSYVVRLVLDSPATGYEGYFSYDTSVLTLTRIVPVNSDLYVDFQVTTETGYVRVTHSQPVRQMLQLTFYVAEGAKPNTEAMVRFYSGSVLEGTSAESVADVSFRFLVVDQKSSDATLRSIDVSVFRNQSDRDQNVNGFMAALTPSFSASHTTYSLTVANEFSHFRVNATTNDSTAIVSSVSDGELTEGAVNTVNVTVRAEDGTQKTYVLQIFREQSSESSIDVSYPVSDTPSEDSSEEPSEIPSDTSSESDDSSEETSEESEESEESDTSSAESFSSKEESENSESSVGSTEESSVTASSDGGSVPSSESSNHTSSGGSAGKTKNLTGVFFCIAAVSVLAIAVLLIRIMVLVHKKRQ